MRRPPRRAACSGAGVGTAEGAASRSDGRQRRRVRGRRRAALGDLRRAVGGQPFNRAFEQCPTRGASSYRERARQRDPEERGTTIESSARAVPRPDVAEKIRGTYEYVQHVRVPGMLHGRVVWPRGQGAHVFSNPTVVAIDEASVEEFPASRSCDGATSSAWWRRGSGMRFVRRDN